jgi:PEP-CTERM motif
MALPFKVLSLAAILATTLTTKADTLDFTLTGGGNTFTFSLPSNPTPDSSTNGTSFTLDNIMVTEGLISFSTDIKFSNLTTGGGLDFSIPAAPPLPGTDLDLVGPQLYGGTEASPVFGPTSTPFMLDEPKGTDDFTLAIADASIPEPASIGLLATGLLAAAGMARRRFNR